MNEYEHRALDWIEDFYDAPKDQEDEILLGISNDDLEVLRYIILNTRTYKALYEKEHGPELADPPAGYQGRQ